MNKLFIIAILLIPYNLFAADPAIKAKTAILLDFDSDKVLYELDADMSIYPASMTKIMTTIVVFDLLEKKK